MIRVDSPLPGLKPFLDGVDPRGERLAFIGIHPVRADDFWGPADVFTVSVDGSDYRQLTEGPGPSDGCEYSPDGEWLYFNTENFDGHAQIARMRLDGSDQEQLTFDECVNWFAHFSPDQRWCSYLAFPPGTEGHRADVWVDVRLVRGDDWASSTSVARIFSGQGRSTSTVGRRTVPRSRMSVTRSSPDEHHHARHAGPEGDGTGVAARARRQGRGGHRRNGWRRTSPGRATRPLHATVVFTVRNSAKGERVSDLSTGTRRICELACLLALDAKVLCLDEPTAGIAQ